MGQLLPENSTLARRLRRAAQGGALPHAIIFSGSGDRMAAARFAAAAMECQAEGGRPCLQCRQCRKVMEDIHPDVQTVQDTDHRELPVDLLRKLRQDAYIRPNDGAAKVYIFPDCDALNQRDQNVLLKLVEEGPPYAAFLFCAENPSVVLQTLRSLCVELKLRPAGEAGDAPPESGRELCRLLAEGKRGSVTELMVRLEKKRTDRDALSALLDGSRHILAAALLALYGKPPEGPDAELCRQLGRRLGRQKLINTIQMLQTYRGACAYNVGVSHVLGALAVELEELL